MTRHPHFALSSRALAFVAILLVCESLPAADPVPPIAFQKAVLPNGLTVVVQEDHRAPRVALSFWFHVGSKDEPLGKRGLAHMMEHLMFGEGQDGHMRQLDRIGAVDANGATDADRAVFFETVPASALDAALWVESERFRNRIGKLEQPDLDAQRRLIESERQRHPAGAFDVEDVILENTYPPVHPYARGSGTDVKTFTVADARQWYETYYGAANAALALIGDFDAADVLQKVERYLGGLPAGQPFRHEKAWVAKMSGVHRQVREENVPEAHLYHVWNIPGYGSAANDYLKIAAECLGGGKQSRLYKRLVQLDRAALSVTAQVRSHEIGGQLRVEAAVKAGQDSAAVERAIEETLAAFLQDGPGAEELENVKVRELAAFLHRNEHAGGLSGKAAQLAMGQLFLGAADAEWTAMRRMQRASAVDVRSAANRWLSDGEYVLEILPLPKPSSAPVAAPSEPAVGPAPKTAFPKLETASLRNGLRIALAERHDLPLVTLWMNFAVGAANAAFPPGAARMAASMLQAGTAGRHGEEDAAARARLGAELSASSNRDSVVVRLSALRQNLRVSVDLLADTILHPTFPEDAIAAQLRRQLSAIRREESSPLSAAERVLPGLLFGHDDPYSAPPSGTGYADGLAKITRADLAKFRETYFLPNNAWLTVVGDTTMAEIRPLIEECFGVWKAQALPAMKTVAAPDPERAIYLVDWPGAAQSLIMAGVLAPPKSNPSALAVEVANGVLGDLLGSRLVTAFRGRHQWAYAVTSDLWPGRQRQIWTAYAAVGIDRTRDALLEMSEQFSDILGAHPITPQELQTVRAHLALQLASDRETCEGVGAQINSLFLFGLPQDYYDAAESELQAMSAGDLQARLQSAVSTDHLVWVIVTDRARVEESIRSLHLGDVHVLGDHTAGYTEAAGRIR